jgi:L-amino acid N-acyltransferase YncA
MQIRKAMESDFTSLWTIFHAVVSEGSTYVFGADVNRQTAFDYWFGKDIKTYVAEDGGRIIGMYKLVANQRDRGAHVANASFMVDPAAAGKGAGRAMGEHCLREAKAAGFLAMQFNFVVSTNERAVRLWQDLGFNIAGTLPKAFQHPTLGYVDAYVMHRFLDDVSG